MDAAVVVCLQRGVGREQQIPHPILVDVEVEGGGKTREIHGLVSVQIGGKFRVDVGGAVQGAPSFFQHNSECSGVCYIANKQVFGSS